MSIGNEEEWSEAKQREVGGGLNSMTGSFVMVI